MTDFPNYDKTAPFSIEEIPHKPRNYGLLIQCGKRYLVTHRKTELIPHITNDGNWNIPMVTSEKNTDRGISLLTHLVFDQTGILLVDHVKQIEEYSYYTIDDRVFSIYLFKDKDQNYMNHKFYSETDEIDSYHWATKKEIKDLIIPEHKNEIFAKKNKSKVISDLELF